MANDQAGEKSEAPTARRLQEAREQGQVPRSTDLTAAAALCGGLLLFKLLGFGMFERMLAMTLTIGDAGDVSDSTLGRGLFEVARDGFAIVVPFLLLLILITGAATLLQSRIVLAWKKLNPSLEKLNPIKGFQKLFSVDSLTRLGMGLVKMAVVGVVAWQTVVGEIGQVLGTGGLAALGAFGFANQVVFTLAMRLGLALLLLALLDYAYQRWRWMRNLRMTKQEVRDELKRMEGDPVMKQRRRQVQAKLAMQRIGLDVPRADVVVTNPTEFAVALKYDETSMAAPRVVAKGKDFLALRIRQVARQHGVPVLQRPPLARAIFAAVEIGQEVPPRFYRAIAEVLAYVYQLTGRGAVARG